MSSASGRSDEGGCRHSELYVTRMNVGGAEGTGNCILFVISWESSKFSPCPDGDGPGNYSSGTEMGKRWTRGTGTTEN